MPEWFCTKCHQVVITESFKCCGPVEEFDPAKHAEFIVGKSNAWVTVWNRWKDHPLLKEISVQYAEEQCYDAAIVLNAFIEQLEELTEH